MRDPRSMTLRDRCLHGAGQSAEVARRCYDAAATELGLAEVLTADGRVGDTGEHRRDGEEGSDEEENDAHAGDQYARPER